VVLSGKTSTSNDPSLFIIKLSNDEFAGLETLPRNPICQLEIKAKNQIGSTHTETKEITLLFDSNPHVDLHRWRIIGGGVQFLAPSGMAKGKDFVIETYELTNTQIYPIGFIFEPRWAGGGKYIFQYTDEQNHSQVLFSNKLYGFSFTYPLF